MPNCRTKRVPPVDELDLTTFAAQTPATTVSKARADELIQLWQKFAEKLDVRLGYAFCEPLF